jgi:hypothetical protein
VKEHHWKQLLKSLRARIDWKTMVSVLGLEHRESPMVAFSHSLRKACQ